MKDMAALQDGPADLLADFAALFGHPPHPGNGPQDLRADWVQTGLGPMIAIADDDALHLLEFHDRKELQSGLRRLSRMAGGRISRGRSRIHDLIQRQMDDFMARKSPELSVPIRLNGTDFQKQVWQALRQIPPGQTRSYAQLAAVIGNPRAVRAVARANATNRLAVIVPCHRVIGADGAMTGYAGGLWRKERLIAAERGFSRVEGAESTGNT